MHRRRVRAAALGLAAIWLLDPSQAEAGRRRPAAIRIVAPAPGSQVTHMPLDFALDLSAQGDLGTLVVLLNGNDITSMFSSAPPSGGRVLVSAQDVWGGWVLPGANGLDVSLDVAAVPKAKASTFDAVGDPYADDVDVFVVGDFGGFPGVGFLPGVVIGPPRGTGLLQGGFDVFSLGFGGEMTLVFEDNVIADGPGDDFTIFENAFMVENGATLTLERPFAEPGVVEVSQDGSTWFTFACLLELDIPQGIVYPGCAGVYPVISDADDPSTPHASIPTAGSIHDLIGVSSIPLPNPGGAGGDSYDLSAVGLGWARYLRVVDPDFDTGDPFGATSGGFDLDAAAAIHSVPATDANGNGIPDAVE